MTELTDKLWNRGFFPNPGTPWTLEDHEKIRLMQRKDVLLQAVCDRTRKYIANLPDPDKTAVLGPLLDEAIDAVLTFESEVTKSTDHDGQSHD